MATVKNIIGVASGKGGVGKLALNLHFSLELEFRSGFVSIQP